MVMGLARRMLTEPDPRALRKLVWNMGVKGVRSVQLYKQRLKRGEHFPPFLFISVISGCQLRCQGCWVDVEAPEPEDRDRRAEPHRRGRQAARQQLLRHPGGRAAAPPGPVRPVRRAPGLLLPALHQRTSHRRRAGGRAAPARQRDAAGQHRGHVRGERRAPRPARRPRQVPGRTRSLHPEPARHRRGHERLQDQHRRPGAGIVAAAADRDGRALCLVPHLPRHRAESDGRDRPDPGGGAPGAPVHRADAREAADRHRRRLLGRRGTGALPDGDRG